MLIHKARKYELDPTAYQRTLLYRTAGCARHAYNWCLAQSSASKELTGKSTPFAELSRLLTQHRGDPDFAWLREVPVVPQCDAVKDLNAAYQAFFQKKAKYPVFKKRGSRDSFKVARSADEILRVLSVGSEKVRLELIGEVRLKEALSPIGRPINATVSRDADRWYIAVAYEVEIADPVPPTGAPVGIVVGLKHFATLSDGTVINSPRALDSNLRKLRRLQRQLSRKVKGSSNRRNAAMKVARLHRRITNIRADHAHKLSTLLATTKQGIAVETLDIKGMVRNDKLARHISDVAWGRFILLLDYKCKWYGSELSRVGQWEPTNKTCSACGYVMDVMPLNIRHWECPACGASHDRDVNDAVNILHKAQ